MSVKKYNNEFNKALALTTLTGADVAILRAYTTGLKPAVRNTSIAMIYANPNILFHRRQALMVEIDELLMQTHQATNPAPKPRTMINNLVFNIQSTLAAATGSARATTAPQGQTPIKVEAARQYTKLTPQERAELARTGSCFRCREQGHMAAQCPRGNQQVNAIEPATPVTPATPATVSDTASTTTATDNASDF